MLLDLQDAASAATATPEEGLQYMPLQAGVDAIVQTDMDIHIAPSRHVASCTSCTCQAAHSPTLQFMKLSIHFDRNHHDALHLATELGKCAAGMVV